MRYVLLAPGLIDRLIWVVIATVVEPFARPVLVDF